MSEYISNIALLNILDFKSCTFLVYFLAATFWEKCVNIGIALVNYMAMQTKKSLKRANDKTFNMQ